MTTPQESAPEPENPEVKEGDVVKAASEREPDVDPEEVPYAPNNPGDPDDKPAHDDPDLGTGTA